LIVILTCFAVIFGLINLGFVNPGLQKVAIEIDSLRDGFTGRLYFGSHTILIIIIIRIGVDS
jgi:hypothetical protein